MTDAKLYTGQERDAFARRCMDMLIRSFAIHYGQPTHDSPNAILAAEAKFGAILAQMKAEADLFGSPKGYSVKQYGDALERVRLQAKLLAANEALQLGHECYEGMSGDPDDVEINGEQWHEKLELYITELEAALTDAPQTVPAREFPFAEHLDLVGGKKVEGLYFDADDDAVLSKTLIPPPRDEGEAAAPPKEGGE